MIGLGTHTGSRNVTVDPGVTSGIIAGPYNVGCGVTVTDWLGPVRFSTPLAESLSENAVTVVVTPPLDVSPVVIG